MLQMCQIPHPPRRCLRILSPPLDLATLTTVFSAYFTLQSCMSFQNGGSCNSDGVSDNDQDTPWLGPRLWLYAWRSVYMRRKDLVPSTTMCRHRQRPSLLHKRPLPWTTVCCLRGISTILSGRLRTVYDRRRRRTIIIKLRTKQSRRPSSSRRPQWVTSHPVYM